MCIAPQPLKEGRVVTWEQLASHAKPDDLWVAVNGRAYDLTAYQSAHPGGALILQHHAGRDASEAWLAYAHNSVPGMRQLMRSHQMERDGLFVPNLWHYARLTVALIAVYAVCIHLVHARCWLSGGLLMSLFWQQLALVGHDVGHNQIFHRRSLDSLVGLFISFFLGASVQWWKYNHNVHHCTPNSSDHDPDIQHMPLFSLSNKVFTGIYSSYYKATLMVDALSKRFISYQHFTFLPVLLVARFGFYIMSSIHLISRTRPSIYKPVEVAAFLGFFVWYFMLVWTLPTWLERIAFFAASHAGFSIIHLQVTLNHWARPVKSTDAGSIEEYGNDWTLMQMASTNNVDCPEWLDWFHGGLQFQIEHHLYPDLPRHQLRRASAYVRPMCHELGIQYHSPPFFQAIAEVLAALKVVALEARVLDLPAKQAIT
ncbi:hypothetical protein WJX81_004156 [Elliptochloris bilobata]|uniref:Cytochrome b5 heme-binding domain-containing protein n=1 Tax=Elliptochloris bilobata TaxID=381761 RepID=A0AAW1QZY6_9CHLO